MSTSRGLVIPTLTEGELTLRPRRFEDADALVAACQDPEISRWTRVPSPYRREHALEFIAHSVTEAQSGQAIGLLAVDDAGTLLGSISIMDMLAAPRYG